ncbi:Zn-dependent hydrolase [Microbispora rosea subsp. aerata]|nr:allantoate amidohydrolase [Microbispora rosea]GGO21735.1 Zn-dependent hydrolase [Microbispora rosea subsp. aerata]GIH53768.1 Zn-dependent hydrolase [Microbispora rosea subsp. aerata]GLJ81762.1 Zn-dependent hydrolase [Microbispora rosea subsp. aerata]
MREAATRVLPEEVEDGFRRMWRDLLPVGRFDATGGYRRHAWTAADAECRAWFEEQALRRGLAYEVDRNGNQWAWLGDPAAGDAVVTGSHLDSVPDGGAYDGPLGVAGAFAAIDALRARGLRPRRPLAVVNFTEEEGARFGLACLGSRLMTGAVGAETARALRDADGVTLAAAMERAGRDPGAAGRDDERLARIGVFVELHVEQGRYLAGTPHPVGVASAIWPHGRWRFDFRGEANHAGTTRLEDRRDPMLAYAAAVLAARAGAERLGALATFGRVRVEPNGTNAIASLVSAWLDCRAPDAALLDSLVEETARAAEGAEVTRESYTAVVNFDPPLRDRVARVLGGAPVLPTGAGHDAGILAGEVPAAMLFVRNPTGVSHSPYEHAEEADCLASVAALATVLEDLLTPAPATSP